MPDPNDSPETMTNSIPGASPAVPTGSLALAGGNLPTGLFSSSAALDADVSGQLALGPTFGAVLESIGMGIATSQEALDAGVVATAKQLSDTDVTVITDVIQELDDDGLPDVNRTRLIEEEVSLINFVTPTVHEWSHMALSMDLSVGQIDNESGLTFDRTQTSTTNADVGVLFGLFRIGVTATRTNSTFVQSDTDHEVNWARGQVRMDAMLRPREVENFTPPAEVVIGPQMFFSQGAIQETLSAEGVLERMLPLTITVRKADGSANPNQILEFDAGPFAPSFIDDAEFNGSTTNAQGQIRVELRRSIPNPRFRRPLRARISVALGAIERNTEISL
jgi:hypothetical protein